VNELRFSTIVLRELFELLVLHDLEIPEAERENREDDGTPHLQYDQANRQAAAIFDWCREFRHIPLNRAAG
jgi:hypothetical protein